MFCTKDITECVQTSHTCPLCRQQVNPKEVLVVDEEVAELERQKSKDSNKKNMDDKDEDEDGKAFQNGNNFPKLF